MQKYINIAELIIAIVLIILILLQNRSAGLGGAFGADDGVFSSKRGIEKTLFITTIVLAALFLGVALANIIIQ